MLLENEFKKISRARLCAGSTLAHTHRIEKKASQFKLVYGFMVLAICLETHVAACSYFHLLLYYFSLCCGAKQNMQIACVKDDTVT